MGDFVSTVHQIQQIINELLGTEVPSDQVCHIALLHLVQACSLCSALRQPVRDNLQINVRMHHGI